MSFTVSLPPAHDAARAAIDRAHAAPEAAIAADLLPRARLPDETRVRVQERAAALVRGVRENRRAFGGLDSFFQLYGLSSKEGVALMCVAEALLRIPDEATAEKLIAEKIGGSRWEDHLGQGDGLFVNASTWALMLTGRVLTLDGPREAGPATVLNRLVKRLGEPVIREALRHGMKIMSRQFVLGRTIEDAIARAAPARKRGYGFSYDMLGEAARTRSDADRFFESYSHAIAVLGSQGGGARASDPMQAPGISVKLSALDPRFEPLQRDDAYALLTDRLRRLALAAKHAGIGLCVDSEEADRFNLTLDIVAAVYADPELEGWDGFGLALPAYQKRALAVLEWLAGLVRAHGRRLPIRLVKGAYWDSEIKRAQERGLDAYPVFTRKAATDVSYLACSRYLLDRRDLFYPQFATHNAQALAYIETLAGDEGGFEFQRLHGMGEPLYDQIVSGRTPVRVYAPVGGYEELLAYLVRRLLENGANSSFVNRLRDDALPVATIIADPVEALATAEPKANPAIPLPPDLYGPARRNAAGLDFGEPAALRPFLERMARSAERLWHAAPMLGDRRGDGETAGPSGLAGTADGPGAEPRACLAPADRRHEIGSVADTTPADVDRALGIAAGAWRGWDARGGAARADILDRMADLLEENRAELMALAVLEAGKILPDALAEVREAVDFCRYYAAEARRLMAGPQELPGPTGEENTLSLGGRGVFVCISPWNFPLAIFTGQVAAALVAGNAVLAKPAEQTPLIAHRAVRLFREAGVPPEVLQLLPGDGAAVGGRLVGDPRTAGVAFTGSVETARAINRMLADRPGPIVPLIAETGGQNAMIVDSTALPEQLVLDVIESAFRSAGQRCSALRVLFVQEDVADRMLSMLAGAAATLRVGDPAHIATDVGPVIDREALAMLQDHAARMDREGRRLFAVAPGPDAAHGTFFGPVAYEIDGLDRLEREVFGPVLHVVRYAENRLDQVLAAIEASGYGLTLGIETRIESKARAIAARLGIGNSYVNRSMIGSVVGVQPFGGNGLSGTGPKAGGPHSLPRFANERTLTVNTAAAGGNVSLVTMSGG
ncbi:MAG: bifunctional proline dehydrogenase/L-glutamate gamma-semialdehyde dehydrogenase PutA [Alphaproteobacteria bacterium]|jgi:RHH-type proline utilization regulon transcriptional repressor/proline dehydrogenase/delta 1-pyrroline-5-carboxylate dehydrogenase|nr:bifunctional proline dehydrogenase/L-glutamate gamma-semialdehyde dehydrogenase PutA [Alphaproteobacteria bacterium]